MGNRKNRTACARKVQRVKRDARERRIMQKRGPAYVVFAFANQNLYLSSRKRLQAFSRMQAPVVACNVRPAFAFEIYDLAWRQAAKVG